MRTSLQNTKKAAANAAAFFVSNMIDLNLPAEVEIHDPPPYEGRPYFDR